MVYEKVDHLDKQLGVYLERIWVASLAGLMVVEKGRMLDD